ncbi:MAG: DUF4013 domain-containing protein [Thermodesulfobacteriota bacterium]
MDKQETRVKCSNCGKTYKIKVPVTDKPVSFKCKNCGNVMKIKLTGAATPEQPPSSMEGLEQFPDLEGALKTKRRPAQAPAGIGSPGLAPDSANQAALPDQFQFEDDAGPDFATLATQPALAGPAPTPGPVEPEFKFETTQLPEEGSYPAAPTPLQALQKTPSVVESLQTGAIGQDAASAESRRWLTLVNEEVRGPFTNEELRAMIENGSVAPDTSLRMGERPWIKASQVPAFRRLFAARGDLIAGKLGPISLADKMGEEEEDSDAPFSLSIGSVLPFPLGDGTNWQPFAIFTGIAIVLCTVLSLEFMIGLVVSIAGWIVLYGYLGVLMQNSMKFPTSPPPQWDFKNIAGIAGQGATVFLVLSIYSLIPVTICLLLMITCFLNGMSLLGYIFLAVTVLVYAGSLFLVPAGLALAEISGNLGVAINPSKPVALIKKAGSSYMQVAGASVAIGLVLMVTAILGILLSDIPGVGFVVVGLLMGAVFSYGHFVWFHVLGLFSRAGARMVGQVVSGAPAN